MSFFKKLLKIIAIVIAIIAIILIIYVALAVIFSSSLTLVAGKIAIGFGLEAVGWQLLLVAALGLGLSAIISPEGFRKVTDRVLDGVKSVGTFVGDVVSSGAKGVFDGIFGPNTWKWVVGLVVVGFAFYALSSRGPPDDTSDLDGSDSDDQRVLDSTAEEIGEVNIPTYPVDNLNDTSYSPYGGNRDGSIVYL